MRPGPSGSAPSLKWRASTAGKARIVLSEACTPISEDEFAARWAALRPGNHVALAVSGGRDSMALARLAGAHCARNGATLIALTVDHGLRESSAAEAKQTVAWCGAIGVRCEILAWRGDKPTTGLQAAARRARYRLLGEAAATTGASAILTAHSADDQAETVFMRLARGSGPRGLGGMEDEIAIAAGAGPPVRLLRPLLSFSRARLTATATAHDQPFIDDPSNDDPKYERVRARALLAALEQNALLSREALLRTASRMRAAARGLRTGEDAAFRAGNGCLYRWGGAALDARILRRARGPHGPGLARRLIRAASGGTHAPEDADAAAALQSALKTGAATLGGAILRVSGERLWFLREPAAILGRGGKPALAPIEIPPGKRVLWDGRFVIENAEGEAPITVRPFGAAASGTADSEAKGVFEGPAEALSALPAAWRDGALIASPARLSKAGRGVRFRSLMEERFRNAVVRFS